MLQAELFSRLLIDRGQLSVYGSTAWPCARTAVAPHQRVSVKPGIFSALAMFTLISLPLIHMVYICIIVLATEDWSCVAGHG